jgi:D-alanine-D-alanine ligase
VSGTGVKVAVVYNAPVLPADHPDAASEHDVIAVAGDVVRALHATEFAPELLPAAPPLSDFVGRLDAMRPDVVFNLVEGFGGRSAGATHLTSVFELLGLPYTGSPVEALAACASKARAKALLGGYGLPTAPFLLIAPDAAVPRPDFGFPALVKPDAEDGSLGIDQGSVVSDTDALARRVELLRRAYGGSVLVEPYLPGPEFNVGLIAVSEPKPLPVAQVLFDAGPGAWPILTYAAKWEEGSTDDRSSPVACPAPIEPALATRLKELAVSAFHATGCRDYARVDLRLDRAGEPMILEVNPNPDLSPRAGWARAAACIGVPYSMAIEAITRRAWRRGRGKPA